MFRIGLSILARSWIAAAVGAGMAGGAIAAECGDNTPDYTAKRTVIVNGQPVVFAVFVSGSKVREEQDVGGKKMFVLRLPAEHLSYAFDPDSKRGVNLPQVEPNKINKTRVVELDQGGSRVRHLQVLSNGTWEEVSATTCSSDGIMLHQTFTSVDMQGRLVTGELTQTDIKIGRLPTSLFRLPDDVVIPQR